MSEDKKLTDEEANKLIDESSAVFVDNDAYCIARHVVENQDRITRNHATLIRLLQEVDAQGMQKGAGAERERMNTILLENKMKYRMEGLEHGVPLGLLGIWEQGADYMHEKLRRALSEGGKA